MVWLFSQDVYTVLCSLALGNLGPLRRLLSSVHYVWSLSPGTELLQEVDIKNWCRIKVLFLPLCLSSHLDDNHGDDEWNLNFQIISVTVLIWTFVKWRNTATSRCRTRAKNCCERAAVSSAWACGFVQCVVLHQCRGRQCCVMQVLLGTVGCGGPCRTLQNTNCEQKNPKMYLIIY